MSEEAFELPPAHLRNMEFHQRFMGQMQRYRDLAELTVDQVAERMGGVDGPTIYAWERRESSPTIIQLFRWASALGLNLRFDLSLGPLRSPRWHSDNHACRYCGALTDLTDEHLVPTSRGGAKGGDNKGTSCRYCNGMKGCLTDDEFMVLRGFPQVRKSIETVIGKYLNILADVRNKKLDGRHRLPQPKPPLTFTIGEGQPDIWAEIEVVHAD